MSNFGYDISYAAGGAHGGNTLIAHCAGQEYAANLEMEEKEKLMASNFKAHMDSWGGGPPAPPWATAAAVRPGGGERRAGEGRGGGRGRDGGNATLDEFQI